MQIRVIGNPETVMGFSLAGVGGRAVLTEDEAQDALDEALQESDAGIILVTKDIASKMQRRMEELKLRGTLPLVVEIPSPEGVPANEASLGELVLRAIGIRL